MSNVHDMSEYPSFLRDVPAYGLGEVGQELQSKNPHHHFGSSDPNVQAALAANAAVAQQEAPFSDKGQENLKATREMGDVVNQLLGPEPEVEQQPVFQRPQQHIPARDGWDGVPESHQPEAYPPSPPPPAPAVEDDVDIPDGYFLLRLDAGDIFLRPSGFQDEDMCVVLYFDDEVLAFRPGAGTRVMGAYDLPGGGRQTYDLYFAGVVFKVSDLRKTAVVFHKAQQ